MEPEQKPRARLSVVEVVPPDMPQQSRGISVRYGIMSLEMPSGEKHSFPVISGGFGLGAIPGMDAPLRSAQNRSFPTTPAIPQPSPIQTVAFTGGDWRPLPPDMGPQLHDQLRRHGFNIPAIIPESIVPQQPTTPEPQRVRAVYEIYAAGRGTGKVGFQSGGADFIVRFVSPHDVKRGLTRAQMDAGKLGAFALHPDGDNGDLPEYVNVGRKHRDGIPDDGNNGCLSLSSKDAKKFQDLYFGIPPSQRPSEIYFLEPSATERLPDMRPFRQSFSGVAR